MPAPAPWPKFGQPTVKRLGSKRERSHDWIPVPEKVVTWHLHWHCLDVRANIMQVLLFAATTYVFTPSVPGLEEAYAELGLPAL